MGDAGAVTLAEGACMAAGSGALGAREEQVRAAIPEVSIMASDDPITIARNSIEAFNAGDWERARALTTQDSVYDEKGTQRRIQGVDQFIEVSRAWRAAFPDAHGTVTNALASGSAVVLEIIWEGTQTGPLPTPGGEIPASGRRVSLPAVQVLTFAGDKIAETRHYFDMMTMMQQLGVVPSATQTTG